MLMNPNLPPPTTTITTNLRAPGGGWPCRQRAGSGQDPQSGAAGTRAGTGSAAAWAAGRKGSAGGGQGYWWHGGGLGWTVRQASHPTPGPPASQQYCAWIKQPTAKLQQSVAQHNPCSSSNLPAPPHPPTYLHSVEGVAALAVWQRRAVRQEPGGQQRLLRAAILHLLVCMGSRRSMR